MNEFCLNLLKLFLDAKRKGGTFVLNEHKRASIQRFIDFDLTMDWMESKEYTALNKFLVQAVFEGSLLVGNPLRIAARYTNLILLRVERQYVLKNYGETLSADETELLQKDRDQLGRILPIIEKFEAIGKRLTRNGKFPKSELEIQKRLAIKGSLNPVLASELSKLKDEWEIVIFEHDRNFLFKLAELARPFVEGINEKQKANKHFRPEAKSDQEYLLYLMQRRILTTDSSKCTVLKSNDELIDLARESAKKEAEDFYYKMAEKLGGLICEGLYLAEIKKEIRNGNAFSSSLIFNFDKGISFKVLNKIIVNYSRYGQPFYQYPTTFHDLNIGGQVIHLVSETQIKKYFIDHITNF